MTCLVNDAFINYCSGKTYNSQPKTFTHLRSHQESTEYTKCCFYDGYPVQGESVGLPRKYKDDKFTVWGHFCSYECARAFVQDSKSHHDKELSLLCLLCMKLYGKYFRLKKAPNKFLLEKYGGPLSIEEWRKESQTNRLWVVSTPSIERTQMTYECFLDHDHESNNEMTNKTKNDSKKETKRGLELSKRKTPAHFTKKSLLQLVKS